MIGFDRISRDFQMALISAGYVGVSFPANTRRAGTLSSSTWRLAMSYVQNAMLSARREAVSRSTFGVTMPQPSQQLTVTTTCGSRAVGDFKIVKTRLIGCVTDTTC